MHQAGFGGEGDSTLRRYADERFVTALMHKLGHEERMIKDRQHDDLKKAAVSLRSSMPFAAVEAYFMEKAGDGHLAITREA